MEEDIKRKGKRGAVIVGRYASSRPKNMGGGGGKEKENRIDKWAILVNRNDFGSNQTISN